MGLYTLPLLFKLHTTNTKIKFKDRVPSFSLSQITFNVKHFFISVFHAIVGFWYAFVPGIGLGLIHGDNMPITPRLKLWSGWFLLPSYEFHK